MNFSATILICFCLILTSNYVNSNLLSDIAKSTVDVSIGVAKKIPDSIPSPDELFSASKNVIAGYPFEVAFTLINTFCSAALSSKQVKPKEKYLPDIRTMNFVLKTKDNQYLIPLTQPEKLWNHHAFNRDKKTTILVTGWTSNINETNSALETVWDAYRCRGNQNFIAIDTAQYVDTLYSWSAFNTEEIGKLLADALKVLVVSYPLRYVHLIGHSLGAHIVGSAGRNFNLTTAELLPRITGLDPANPCFNEGENLNGLSRGDAAFVDIIHTNNGALGKRDPMGDVDFYPNGLVSIPPGCISIVCAHGRAWEYYAETVYPGNEYSLQGVKCSSITKLNSNYCNGPKYTMGMFAPHHLKGNYFLKTKASSPYGNGISKSNVVCPY